MIDPTQLPILLKAIDFIFDEGHKILDERRERRKKDDAAPQMEGPTPAKDIVPVAPEKVAEIKQDMVTSRIDELLWQNHEKEIQHLVNLLKDHTQNYYLLKEQYAKWGSALVPPIIVNQLNEKEDEILATTKQLEAVLSKVYGKDIRISQ